MALRCRRVGAVHSINRDRNGLSAFPPIATELRTSLVVRFVPNSDLVRKRRIILSIGIPSEFGLVIERMTCHCPMFLGFDCLLKNSNCLIRVFTTASVSLHRKSDTYWGITGVS